MAATVKNTEKYKHAQPSHNLSKNRAPRDESIWVHAGGQYPQQQQQPRPSRPQPGPSYQQRGPQQQQPRQPPPQQPSSSNYNSNNSPQLKCFNCDKIGHTRKVCKICSFCKVFGHSAKDCAKRITVNKGKYCLFCGMSDYHVEKDCRKKQAGQSTTGHVHMLYPEEKNDTYDDQYEGTEQCVAPYDSTTYDEIQEEGGTQQY